MSIDRRKLIAIVCFLLGILGGVLIDRLSMPGKFKDSPADIPRRVVTITIDQNQRDDLFNQLQKFADKWRYAIRIAPLDPSGSHFSIGLWRSDIKVLGAYLADSATLQVAFFYTESTRPVPERYFDEEVNDLKIFIGEIPNATFTVGK